MRKNNLRVLGFAATLVFFASVGTWLLVTQGDWRPQSLDVGDEPTAAHGSNDEQAVGAAQDDDPQEAPRSERPTGSRSSSSSPEDAQHGDGALEESAPDEKPAAAVMGTVRSTKGEPLAGVVVYWSVGEPRLQHLVAPSQIGRMYWRETDSQGRVHRRRLDPTYSETDADGRFRFPIQEEYLLEFRERRWFLIARAPEPYAFAEREVDPEKLVHALESPEAPVELGEFVVPKGSYLTGRVTNDQGEPILGAQVGLAAASNTRTDDLGVVHVEQWGRPRSPKAETNEEGRFRHGPFLSGEAVFSAEAELFHVEVGTVTLREGETSELDFVLRSSATLRVIVRCAETGERIPRLMGPSVRLDDGRWRRLSRSTDTPEFVWQRLEQGQHKIGVRARGYQETSVADVRLTRGEVTTVEVELEPDTEIRLRPLDADTGEPLFAAGDEDEHATVASELVQYPRIIRPRHVIQRDTDGYLRIRSLPANVRRLMLRVPGYRVWHSAAFDSDEGGIIEWGDILLHRAPHYLVRVVDDASGAAVADAALTVRSIRTPLTLSYEEFTPNLSYDADEIAPEATGEPAEWRTPLIDGDYVVFRAEHDDYATAVVEKRNDTTATRTVEIRLQRPGRVVGRRLVIDEQQGEIYESSTGSMVLARRTRGYGIDDHDRRHEYYFNEFERTVGVASGFDFAPGEKTFDFDGLPPGRYRLEIGGGTRPGEWFDLQPGETLQKDFTSYSFRSYHQILLVEAGSSLYGRIRPAAGIPARLATFDENGEEVTLAEATSDEHGRIAVELRNDDDAARRQWRDLHLWCTLGPNRSVALYAGTTGRGGLARMRLPRMDPQERAALRVWVFDAAGYGTSATLRFERHRRQVGNELIVERPEVHQYAELTDLPPGFFDVHVVGANEDAEPTRVRLRPGETSELEIRLPAQSD